MHQPDKQAIIDSWIEKADEALKSSVKNIELELLPTAQNRIYYSFFYSTMALAYFKNFKTSKHTELQGWFNKNFIKTSIFKVELGRMYKKAFDNRNQSDYTITFTPDKEELIEFCKGAESFISSIKNYIKNKG